MYVIVYSPLETGLWAWTRFYSRFLTQVTLCLVQKEKLPMHHPIVPECKEFMEALWVKEGTTQFRTANYCNNFAWLHLLTVLFSVANFVSWGFCWSSLQVKNHVLPQKPAMCFTECLCIMLCVFMSDGLQLLYRSVCVFDVKKQQNGETESLHQYWSLHSPCN